jgi:hypothetical protein
MKIQIFKNGKGLIYGNDSKRISCDIEGTLCIASAEVKVSPEESVMPVLLNGCSGSYNAVFKSISGSTYQLERVELKGGRIVPPSASAVEHMELRCRIEALEEALMSAQNEMDELRNIFDTNSLNFLIN